MASRLYKTVKPSGGDYTSLEACMNANEQNLVTADKYFDVEIDGTWSSADTTAVTVHNYTTDNTRYINIYTTSTARHNGTIASGYKIVPSDTASPCASIGSTTDTGKLKIFGIIFDGSGLDNGVNVITIANYSGIIFANNIAKGKGANSGNILNNVSIRNTSLIYNNILYNATGLYQRGIHVVSTSTTDAYYNNTIYNCYRGIDLEYLSGNGGIIKNNLIMNCTTCINNVAGARSGNNNATSDATGDDSPLTTGAVINKTSYSDYFVDTTIDGGEDFHLKSTATDFIGAGEDLSATFTTDIDGTTRPTGANTWDIGADEYLASSASSSPSASPSNSPSASVSGSPSGSPSGSASGSPSASVSGSPSSSPSATPSAGYAKYTKGEYAALPANDDDLTTEYTDDEYIAVTTDV